ncbi:MAG: GDSL-type esterase/lipase family protein [Bacteroidales bacterium]|nr:GDSL-type esterase/lipase family protein [Bacteroidales bacterium]
MRRDCGRCMDVSNMHNSNSILFIGDSLTEWFDLDKYFPGIHIVNEGIAGDTSYGLLERIDEIMSIPAAMIFMMIGINDILNGYLKNDIIENHQLLLEDMRTQSTRSEIIAQSLLPVNLSMSGLPGSLNNMISEINEALRAYCEDCRVQYLNLYPSFLLNNELNSNYTSDGVHLSEAGYSLWAEKLKPVLT